jgi:hypothetical protein
MTHQLDNRLIELAFEIVHYGELTLKTDKGIFDFAELNIYWHAGEFVCRLTTYEEGQTTYGPTWYDPPETEWREATYEDSFRKIKQVDEWAKQHHFEIDSTWSKQ